MKKINGLLLILTLVMTLLCFVSCSGPEEPRGTNWYYGSEEPSDTLYTTIGDFYMRTGENEVYVLEDEGWVKLASLNGKDGKNGLDGADGTEWIYDSKSPTDLDGADGNIWFNTSTLELYKKTEGKWELLTTLK